MYSFIVEQVSKALSSNQFLSGGLVLGVLTGALVYLKGIPGQLWDLFLRKCTVSLEISNDTYCYKWFLAWLDHQPYSKKTRKLMVKSGTRSDDALLIPGYGNHYFWWNKTPLWLTISKEGAKGTADSLLDKQTISIRLLGRDRARIRVLVNEAKALLDEETHDKLALYVRKEAYGQTWECDYREKRAIESVFLPIEATDLLEDMKRFLARKEDYVRLGIPYRRGYLFHGAPGSGKSSTVVAIASELNLPLYVLNLGAIKEDVALERAIGGVDSDEPIILLLEDVDTATPKREVNKEKQFFSLGTLLNALDGVIAKENVIMIMTTNHKETMDPALIRPGRVDKMVEFTLATEVQVRSAIRLFFPNKNKEAEDLLLPMVGAISMATVQEHLLRLWSLENK